MTEGIIQKIFQKYIDAGYNTDTLAWFIRTELLPQLQQELIEEIKKLKPKYYSEVLETHHPIIKELIGDNE